MLPNTQKEFEIIYSQAENLLRTLPEYQFKTAAALIIIIGWLLTAETAQTFIHSNASTVLPATAFAFGVLAIFKIFWIRMHVNKINVCYSHLLQLATELGLSTASIDIFKLNPVITYTYYFINTLMSLAIFVTVYLICQ